MIAFLGFGLSPRLYWPPGRIRALLAEAALQGAEIGFMDSRHCLRPDGLVRIETWEKDRFVARDKPWPALTFTVGHPRVEADRAVEEAARVRTHLIRESSPAKDILPGLLEEAGLGAHVIAGEPLLPDTAETQIAAWARRCGAVVVKSTNGKRGGGIFFLEGGRDGGPWRLRKDREEEALPLEDAAARLFARIRGRMAYRGYIVQRFVTARTTDGRAADLRVHVQRREDGGWAVTRAYVRLGEAGLPLSNTSRGGYQGETTGFLSGRGRPPEVIAREVEELALAVTRATAERHCPDLTELGVDIALDREDRLWVIEVNAHPGTALHEQERAVHLIAHARALAASRSTLAA